MESHFMIPFVTTLSGLFLRPLSGSKGEAGAEIADAIKGHFNPDHAFLARDERHAIHARRALAAKNDAFRSGRSGPDGDSGVDWREYAFAAETTLGECCWHSIRWRFYRKGRISFQAAMINASGRFDAGDMQGHRIELRSTDGLLIGAWTAAFFVRSETAVREFPASILDEHPLLALHFDELDECQVGYCFFER